MTAMTDNLPIRLADARIDPAYVEQVCRRQYDEGEKKLMLAVLQEALNNFVQFLPARKGTGQEQFREIEEWFWGDGGEWPFSFRNIAETLGISTSYFLNGLMRLKLNKLHGWSRAHCKVKPFRIGRTAYRTRYTGLAKNRRYRRIASSSPPERVALTQ
jgi:hypothetical protein